jgi:hypothetical protein
MDELGSACHICDHEKVREILISSPTDFCPTDGIGDLVWNAKNRSILKQQGSKVVSLG